MFCLFSKQDSSASSVWPSSAITCSSSSLVAHFPGFCYWSSTLRRQHVQVSVVDRFSKMAHFVSLLKYRFAKETAQLILLRVFHLDDILVDIAYDSGPQFASNFWKEFWSPGLNSCCGWTVCITPCLAWLLTCLSVHLWLSTPSISIPGKGDCLSICARPHSSMLTDLDKGSLR